MQYKAPGKYPVKSGLSYLPPGDVTATTAPSGEYIEPNNVFNNGIIVSGGIQTDDIVASGEGSFDTINVNSGSSFGGDMSLSEDTQILHGTKFRTRIEGERLIREYSADGGTTWIPGDEIGE